MPASKVNRQLCVSGRVEEGHTPSSTPEYGVAYCPVWRGAQKGCTSHLLRPVQPKGRAYSLHSKHSHRAILQVLAAHVVENHGYSIRLGSTGLEIKGEGEL